MQVHKTYVQTLPCGRSQKFHHGKAWGLPSPHSDKQFLTVFNSIFSLSKFKQMPFWQVVTPTAEMSSRDLNSLWDKVAFATMDCAARATNWRNWSFWCRCFNFSTFLIGTPKEQHAHVLMAFAARVPAGTFGNGKQIGCQSVATALRHVVQTFVLAN